MLFACGLMAKPMVVTLPCVLLLLDFWPLQRFSSSTSAIGASEFSRRPALHLFLEKLPLLALSAASAVITILAQLRANAVMTVAQTSIVARIEHALCAYALYLVKAIWPFHLGVFDPPWSPNVGQAQLALLFLCAISVWTWRERGSKPYLLTGWLWYLGTLVPVIGLVQVGLQSMADRYAYIPLIGIFLMLVWLAADITATLAHPQRFQVPAAAVILLALAAITVRQVAFWRGSIPLWSHTSQVTGDNFIAEDNLAMALTDAGRDDEAISHFENAIRILPVEPKADIGVAFLLRQRDPQSSIAHSQAALRLTRDRKDLLAIYTNLGVAYRETGDYGASANSFQEVLKIDPSNGVAMMGAGSAMLLKAAGRLAHNLESNPSVEGFTQLGNLYSQAGDKERAKQAFQSAESLRGKFPAAPR
jgi:tetratricopeptide (TPR) repeat protein